METPWCSLQTLSPTSGSDADGITEEKSRFCFICATPIQNCSKIGEETSCSSSEVSLKTFLKGVDVLCEALEIGRKPFTRRDDEWIKFAELDNFIKCICCGNCSSLFVNLVSLQELIVSTKKRLEGSVNLIENFIVDSAEGNDGQIEYFDRSCIQFRKDVLTKFLERTQGTANNATQLLDISTSTSIATVEIASRNNSTCEGHNEPKAKRSKRFNHPPSEKLGEVIQNIKREEDESRSSQECAEDDSWDGEAESSSPRDYETENKSSRFVDENDEENDFKYDSENGNESESSSSSSSASEEEYIPEPKRRKSPRKDPLELRNYQEPEPSSSQDPPVKRGRGRPRKYPQPRVPVRKDPVKRKLESQVEKGKKASKRYQKMWRTKDDLLQHGPCARPILVLDSQNGYMMYLHVKIQLQQPNLYCKHPECDFYLANAGNFGEQEAFLEMKRHIRYNHRKCFKSKVSGSEGGYCCCYCDELFSTRALLLKHRRTHHPNEKPPNSLCEICGKILPQKSMFLHALKHKNEQEQLEISQIRRKKRRRLQSRPPCLVDDKPKAATITESEEEEVTEFRCDQCNKTFSSNTILRNHILTHIDVDLRRKYECDICHAKLTSPTGLKYHKRDVHSKIVHFTCAYCGRTFTKGQMTFYKSHVRLHTGKKPYQCSVCGEAFVGKHRLTVHELTHEQDGNVQLQCEFCPKLYKHIRSLSKHQQKHHAELLGKKRNSEDARSSTQSTRFDHLPDFIGPKLAYPCEPCGRVYRYKSVLVTHMKTKHKVFLPSNEDYPNQNIIESYDCGQPFPQ